MEACGVAVKGFIVNDEDEVLLLRRHPDDEESGGVWEIPGGRLEQGEDPFTGLRREVREEAGIEVSVSDPLMVDHFTRRDGVRIIMLVFLCRPVGGRLRLSHEHTASSWTPVSEAHRTLDHHFLPCLKRFLREFSGKP